MVSFQFGFRNNLRWWQSLEEDPDKDGLEDEDSLNRGREALRVKSCEITYVETS